MGADCIVTACPMCHSNLDTRQKQINAKFGESFKHADLLRDRADGPGVRFHAKRPVAEQAFDEPDEPERERAMARIGVFVCHCGSNIAAHGGCETGAEAVGQMPDVVFATDYMFMCSEPGQKLIQDAIREHKLDRVVVAACSPTMHFKTFSGAIQRGGLNPYMLEMANIREQCSWVHPDKAVGTAKATDIVRMAAAKTRWLEPLSPREIGVTRRALVIGGGIAGIQAALDIANAGVQVVLVERSPSIGGRMAQLDKTFPTLDCSGCILTPRMTEVAQHPNITLHTWAEVEAVRGFVGNFEVDILHKPRYVDDSKCTGCGECLTRCPWKGFPSEFDEGMGKRAAIYRPFPQAVPNKPVIDPETLHGAQDRCRRRSPDRKKPKCGAVPQVLPARGDRLLSSSRR